MTQPLLYTANVSNATGIVSGSMLPLGSTVRQVGSCIDLSGESILLHGKGYYLCIANFVLSPSVSDTVTVQAYVDGVSVPGAKAEMLSDSKKTYSVSFVTKNPCPCNGSTIDFRVSTAISTTTVTQSVSSVVVKKL